ncbi:NAD-dependent epimerase/dehydratase family protein [Paenibacillus piscarius]|uniref:NAD-dependent epimerase/dehydratase family protein n=1 Tax=Paenibacillus piscarius TaxID=1089681 RepID=UPI001EE814D9|nr:NAD(P)-dependent oxidoreductase [Paenibacillus piscarius]
MSNARFDRIIMTGYSSFVGSHVLKYLLNAGIANHITLLGRKPQFHTPSSWQYWDLNVPQPAGVGYNGRNLLIHFAAQLPGPDAVDYQDVYDKEADFLERYRIMRITDVVYASTGGVYGYAGNRKEHDPPQPEVSYSRYKLAIEENIACLWPHNHLILRYYFPFGAEQKRPRLFPELIYKLMANQTIRIDGERYGLTINPVQIEDAAEASVWLIRNNLHGVYNIAGRHTLTMLDLIQQMGRTLKQTPILEYSHAKDRVMTGSIDKLLEQNDKLISTPWEEAIHRTLAHYLGG